jgi:adenylate cyclase
VPEPQPTHRLAAIASADVAGYTRLLAADESATIRALADMRERMTASVARYGGRVVDSPGDNVLAEFAAAQDAMRGSVEIQRIMEDRDAALPAERRMRLRIGIHLGDIAAEGERIHGDGVNVAARLQTLADPGGICLSAAVYDNVASRLDLAFEDIGEQALKNFPRPVRAFKLGGVGAAVARPAAPFEPPADRPSLEVLPFANVSGDPEQEFFADGMSERAQHGCGRVEKPSAARALRCARPELRAWLG